MYSLIARSIECKEEQLMMGLTVSRYLQVEGSCREMLRDTPSTHLGSAAVQTCNTHAASAGNAPNIRDHVHTCTTGVHSGYAKIIMP